jgi:hypothetical protein
MEQSQKMGHTKTSGNGQGWRKVNGREMACKNQKIRERKKDKNSDFFYLSSSSHPHPQRDLPIPARNL